MDFLRKLLVLFGFFSFSSAIAGEKVLIFSYSYNRPDFIEIQHKTFKKFLLDDYEFIIFNDAVDPVLYQGIRQKCADLDIRCIDMPQNLHKSNSASVRNADIVNYSLRQLGFDYNGIVVLLDSDLFLVREFSIVEYMRNYALGGLYQERSSGPTKVDYLWVGIVFLDMQKLPSRNSMDFSPGNIKGVQVDTGGFTHHYLSRNRDVPVRYMNSYSAFYANKELTGFICPQCDKESFPCRHALENLQAFGLFDKEQVGFLLAKHGNTGEYFLDGNFYHYGSGTNWTNHSPTYHEEKTRSLNAYIQAILKE